MAKRPRDEGRGRKEKIHAVYDENARKEWLDFRKRKNVRRKVAQAILYEKERDAAKTARLESREASRAATAAKTQTIILPIMLAPPGVVGAHTPAAGEEEEYNDDFTKRAFGTESVVVTTRVGLLDGEEVQHLELESRERLRELAAPVLEAQRLRREKALNALETKRRVAAAERLAKKKKKRSKKISRGKRAEGKNER